MSRDQRPGQAKIVDNGKISAASAERSAASASPAAVSSADEPAARSRWLSNGVIGLIFCAATVGSAAAVAALMQLPL